jgi:hypothetical protein
MKTIPQILEEFNSFYFESLVGGKDWSVDEFKQFLNKSPTQILDELPTDEKIKELPSGTEIYQFNETLINHIKKIKGDI